MIIDGHCHAWTRWPYQPPVPDPESRGRVEQLLYEMDRNGVERAVLISAGLGGNEANADYAMDAARRHPGRLIVFPDLECRWAPHYRTRGAVERLEAALGRGAFAGFTHYPEEVENGDWFWTGEGLEFFTLAAERGLVASLSVMPHQMPAVGRLAAALPGLIILIHHYGFLGPRSAATPGAEGLIRAVAAHPNVYVKLSGMGNVAGPAEMFPYPGLAWVRDAVRAAFGPERLIWGSDYPVSRRHMTYGQTLALVRAHSGFSEAELGPILGGTLARLLGVTNAKS